MSGTERAWNTAWYGPVSSARVWLITRLVLGMAALDMWMLMVPKGGRYGAGGFNVAHWRWVESLAGVPTPETYVGLILLSGFLAALGATGVLRRVGIGLLAAIYASSWMISQLDSYQHHYFITWVFVALALAPYTTARRAFGPALTAPRQMGAVGFKLLGALCAILYFYTGVSKTEAQWRSGEVLIRINASEGKLEPFRDFAMNLGFSESAFWSLMGNSVVLVQWVIAAAYLSYVLLGERRGRVITGLRTVGLLAALSFHAGAEYFGLRIGWFSYYMFATTLVFFLPEAWVHAAGWALTWPWRKLQSALEPEGDALPEAEAEAETSTDADAVAPPAGRPPLSPLSAATALVLAGLAAWALIAGVGDDLDLPGAPWAVLCGAAIAGGLSLWRLYREGSRGALACVLGTSVAALALMLSIQTSSARYDFYRFVGGDAYRRGELERAQDAYARANTYAPEGESRFSKVIKVRKRMSRAPVRRN